GHGRALRVHGLVERGAVAAARDPRGGIDDAPATAHRLPHGRRGGARRPRRAAGGGDGAGGARRGRVPLPPAVVHREHERHGGEGLMATVSFQGVRKDFGGVTVVHGFDLEVADGELVVLV